METGKTAKWLCSTAVAMATLFSPITFYSCKENIDESAYAIAEKKQIVELLESDTAQYSNFIKILSDVKLGTSDNASKLISVLSSRGNYTVFAPTNEAFKTFLHDKLKLNSINELSDEQKKMIAYNCVIDNGDNAAYELADFPANGTTFGFATLDDRRLTSEQKASGDYYINADAKIIKSNAEASNGMLHTVDHVIFPSTQSVADIVASTPNTRIMGQLMALTGWKDKLDTKISTNAEDKYLKDYAGRIGTKEYFEGEGGKYPFMSKRRVRYTAFVEPDQVLHDEWGIPLPEYDENANSDNKIKNWDAILQALESKCEAVMGETAKGDYTNEDNTLNRFVAYHILEGGMPLNGIVQHYNEFGYDLGSDTKNPQTKKLAVNIWDYYTTIGKHRALLKVTQVGGSDYNMAAGEDATHYFINRISRYDDSFNGTYEELGHTPNSVANGLNVRIMEQNEVADENGDTKVYPNNALNGYFYTINHILVNSKETYTALGSERIRFDVTTMLPEMLSNDLRISDGYQYFPKGYFSNILNEGQSTKIFYLSSKSTGGPGWKDAQGDEFLVTGAYNFVMKLPPVPKSGSYELRMGVVNNLLRSMVQCYLDEGNSYPVTPTSLPIDQRENAATDWPGKIWVKDEDNNFDEAICRECDRNLRNMGYLKGPNYWCLNGSKGKTTVREHYTGGAYGPNLRYIVKRQYFDKDKTYYIRFKCAVDNPNSQFFLDYFEFCPSEVYDSPTGEDIW